MEEWKGSHIHEEEKKAKAWKLLNVKVINTNDHEDEYYIGYHGAFYGRKNAMKGKELRKLQENSWVFGRVFEKVFCVFFYYTNFYSLAFYGFHER